MAFLKKIKYFLFAAAGLFFVSLIISSASQASSLYRVSDLISTSRPATSTDHILTFTVYQAVPPGGKIIVDFQGSGLNVPAAFDYLDLDLAAAASGSEIYLDRQLGTTTGAATDGVAINSGLGGKITITLNSSAGFGSGDKVRIKMGANAGFGGNGDTGIINAVTAGSYRLSVKTYNAANGLLDNAKTFVVMIEPVAVGITVPKIRANGLPTGVLNAGTASTIMSLTTNYRAVCRYSDAANQDYYTMINDFYTSDNIYHTYLLTNLIGARCYEFFIRCHDETDNTVDLTDYSINFCIAAAGEGGTGGGTGGGTSSGGGGGGGGGLGNNNSLGNFKLYPLPQHQLPSVAFSGWSYPGGSLTVAQDNLPVGEISAKGDASFIIYVDALKKGVYTFTLASKDSEGAKSPVYPSTFSIEENTQTNISNILIPPTIRVVSSSVAVGRDIGVAGQSAPNQKINVELSDPKSQKLVSQREEKVLPSGHWSSSFPTVGLAAGIYELKAQFFYPGVGWSFYSEKVQCGLGVKLEQGPCSRSDINKDGKVNLVDFSVLMFYWGTTNATADINQDGKINLVDFSILMYCWTG